MADTQGFGRRALQARLDLSARRGKTVTQVAIAEEMGVTSATVGRWEAGLKEPNLETIARLAEVLEVSAGWLAFAEEPHISYRATLPPPGQNAENMTGVPKQQRSQARRQKRA